MNTNHTHRQQWAQQQQLFRQASFLKGNTTRHNFTHLNEARTIRQKLTRDI